MEPIELATSIARIARRVNLLALRVIHHSEAVRKGEAESLAYRFSAVFVGEALSLAPVLGLFG